MWRVLPLVAAIILAAIVLVAAWPTGSATAADRATCRQMLDRATAAATPAPDPSPLPTSTPSPSRNGAAERRLTIPQSVDGLAQVLEGAAELRFAFGADREPALRRQPMRIPPELPMPAVGVTAPFGDLVDDEGRALPADHVAAAVLQRGPGRLATVGVCIDPSRPSEIRPAEYTGTALVGAGEQAAPVALRVTLKDDRGWLVFLAALVGVTAGLFVKLFADNRSEGLPATFGENLRSLRTLIAIGAGLVTAVYSYLTIYADDPTFAADFANLWRVTAEAFAGTLAAKALTDIAGHAGHAGQAGRAA